MLKKWEADDSLKLNIGTSVWAAHRRLYRVICIPKRGARWRTAHTLHMHGAPPKTESFTPFRPSFSTRSPMYSTASNDRMGLEGLNAKHEFSCISYRSVFITPKPHQNPWVFVFRYICHFQHQYENSRGFQARPATVSTSKCNRAWAI